VLLGYGQAVSQTATGIPSTRHSVGVAESGKAPENKCSVILETVKLLKGVTGIESPLARNLWLELILHVRSNRTPNANYTPVAQLVLRVGCRRVGTYGDVSLER